MVAVQFKQPRVVYLINTLQDHRAKSDWSPHKESHDRAIGALKQGPMAFLFVSQQRLAPRPKPRWRCTFHTILAELQSMAT
ncbi:hypothetical protein CS176_0104 [Corynebacterium glutamicum]|nr:hypothetical protein CS176_0104 [Corynebacterium glutamicum]